MTLQGREADSFITATSSPYLIRTGQETGKNRGIQTEHELYWTPIIQTYASQYNVGGAVKMSDVIRCESGFDPSKINHNDPHGGSFGIAQFQISTFYDNASASGLFVIPDINNPEQQIELMAWMWAHGKAGRWSCWYIVQGLPVPWVK